MPIGLVRGSHKADYHERERPEPGQQADYTLQAVIWRPGKAEKEEKFKTRALHPSSRRKT